MRVEVYARRPDLQRGPLVEGYVTLRTTERLHGPGEWLLELRADNPAIPHFRVADAGIDVRGDDGEVIFAGPVNGPVIDRMQGGKRSVIVSGIDDQTRLAERISVPDPTIADPASWTSAHDIHTGQLSTALINFVKEQAGPAPTGLAARMIPKITFADDPLIGPSPVTISARLTPVLDVLAQACAGTDVVAQLRQEGENLVFRVREAITSPNVLFDPELGGLDWSYQEQAPRATTVYVAGAGELDARLIRRVDAAADTRWPRRIEALYDQRAEDDAALLVSAGESFLADNKAQQSLRLDASAGQWRFRRDFDLGDRVTAKTDEVKFIEAVTVVETTYGAGPRRVAVTVGPEQFTGPLDSPLRRARRLENRMSNVEAS